MEVQGRKRGAPPARRNPRRGWLKGGDLRPRVPKSSEGLVKGRRSLPSGPFLPIWDPFWCNFGPRPPKLSKSKVLGCILSNFGNFKQFRSKTAQFKTPARGRPSETFRNLPTPFETFQNLRLRRAAQSSDFTSVQFALL